MCQKAFGLVLLALSLPARFSQAQNLETQPSIWNPALDTVAFEKIENEHLARVKRAIEALNSVAGPRSIANTLVSFDDAIAQLDSADYLADVMQNVHPDAPFRDAATSMESKVSAAQAALYLDKAVYKALREIDQSDADAATRYYIKRQLLKFHLAGADLDDPSRARLQALRERMADEVSRFNRNIADDKSRVLVKDSAELQGLPQDYIDSHHPDLNGHIYITMRYPDVFPALTYASSEELRRRLAIAFLNRAYPQNRDTLRELMGTRYEIASVLGYASWADYNAQGKMIEQGRNIANFIDQLDAASALAAKREFALLLAEKRKTQPSAKYIWMYDSFYYKELVRRARYDFDSQSIRPYLAYSQVKRGILDIAARFFRVTYTQDESAPAWATGVETWNVLDQGEPIGRFYLDMHPRDGKYHHDATFPLRDGIGGKQLPEAVLVCNFPEPLGNDPGLMPIEDVITFFHEFGHLMHAILGGHQRWAGISGISMESDFVEAPSEMLESLIRDPNVLTSFARHFQTGDPIPEELVKRLNRASAFGRARSVRSDLAFAAISYDYYKQNPVSIDVDRVSDEDLRKYSLVRVPENTHQYASFDHLANYSSAYYTYMWDQVIAEDFFSQFDFSNPLDGPIPDRYRKSVLEPGGSMPASELVTTFLGRAQSTAAFKRWMGEEFINPQQ